MIDPISGIISLGLPLVQAGISAIGMGKARREQDKAYNELMSQNFGATASARNYARNAVSGKAMQDAFAQMNKTMASGLSALSKGGARTAMQAGNVAEAGLNAQANLGLQMQNIQNQANQFVASQDFQGQQMRRNLEAQNVAGLAQREMQSQMGLQQGLQGLGRNALQIALGGGINWGGGEAETPPTTVSEILPREMPQLNTNIQGGTITRPPEMFQGYYESPQMTPRTPFNIQGGTITRPPNNGFDFNQQNAQALGFIPAIGGVLGMGFPFGNMMNDGFSLNQGQQQTAPQQREQEGVSSFQPREYTLPNQQISGGTIQRQPEMFIEQQPQQEEPKTNSTIVDGEVKVTRTQRREQREAEKAEEKRLASLEKQALKEESYKTKEEQKRIENVENTNTVKEYTQELSVAYSDLDKVRKEMQNFNRNSGEYNELRKKEVELNDKIRMLKYQRDMAKNSENIGVDVSTIYDSSELIDVTPNLAKTLFGTEALGDRKQVVSKDAVKQSVKLVEYQIPILEKRIKELEDKGISTKADDFSYGEARLAVLRSALKQAKKYLEVYGNL